MFNIHNSIGKKLVTRLRLELTYLNERRFYHKFQNCTKPKCISKNDSASHFFLYCHFYIPISATLFDKLKEIGNNLQEVSNQTVTTIPLHGSPNLKDNQNLQILKFTNKYTMDSKRFTGSLF